MTKYFAYLIAFTFLISCNTGNNSISYNDTIIEPQLEVITKLDSIYANPEVSVQNIKKHRIELVKKINEAMDNIRNLGDFKGNTAFKEAAMKYFSHLNFLYGKTNNIDSLIYNINSPERAEKMKPEDFELMDRETQKYLDLEEALLAEQKKFAEQFNMRLDY